MPYPLDSWRLYIPLVTGFIFGAICDKNRDKARNVRARPPRWVFGVVWFMLYILIGFSWQLLEGHKYTDYFFLTLLVLLNLWIILESCIYRRNSRFPLYVLALSFTTSLGIVIYGMNIDEIAAIILLPLVGWLFYAFNLGFWDFNIRK